MTKHSIAQALVALVCITFECRSHALDSLQSEVLVDKDGTVHVPAFTVPLSSYMSAEAKRRFVEKIESERTIFDKDKDASISMQRESVDTLIRPKVERAKAAYPVNIEERRIGGIRTHIVTPREGVASKNAGRVLINLHGGGFMVGGAGLHGSLESIPIAAIGKFKVITVDYRMAPEFKFPAASEDVASVYRALLKEYRSTSIGIYGCSAGGLLTAMATAWFQKERLPVPGAIGILSAAAFGNFYPPGNVAGSWSGDSIFTTPPLVGERPLVDNQSQRLPSDSYLSNANLSDPLVSPAMSQTVLAKFPPTLLVTGTRAYDMSAAVETQREMTKSGAKAELHLWDGMGHCFFLEEDLPESREALNVVAHFFDEHLH